jgi:type II secretory pathway component PulF
VSGFRYEAVDAAGKVARGVVEADTARAARDRLRAQGLTPTAVDEARTVAASGHGGWSAADTAMFTRQWATLTQAGMPADQALAAVAEQADSLRVRKVVEALRGHVVSGESLPAALGRFPRSFPALYRGLVGAGAESGRLGEVLSRLADYLEARQTLRQKFATALIYPALVTLVALGVIAVLLVYVVPQVVAVYEQSRQTLPWLTRALIATSAFFRATGWLWLLAAVALAVAATDRRRRGCGRGDGARGRAARAIAQGAGAVSAGARPPRRQRRADGAARADARAGRRRAGARCRDAADVARGTAAAGADRADGRDRAGARARRDAADRVDEPAGPLRGGSR